MTIIFKSTIIDTQKWYNGYYAIVSFLDHNRLIT